MALALILITKPHALDARLAVAVAQHNYLRICYRKAEPFIFQIAPVSIGSQISTLEPRETI